MSSHSTAIVDQATLQSFESLGLRAAVIGNPVGIGHGINASTLILSKTISKESNSPIPTKFKSVNCNSRHRPNSPPNFGNRGTSNGDLINCNSGAWYSSIDSV